MTDAAPPSDAGGRPDGGLASEGDLGPAADAAALDAAMADAGDLAVDPQLRWLLGAQVTLSADRVIRAVQAAPGSSAVGRAANLPNAAPKGASWCSSLSCVLTFASVA